MIQNETIKRQRNKGCSSCQAIQQGTKFYLADKLATFATFPTSTNRVVKEYIYRSDDVTYMSRRKTNINIILSGHRQLLGCWNPASVPPAWLQSAIAGLFRYVSFTSWSLIPVHGFFELQSNFTPTCVADVPWMSKNITSLIFIPETYYHHNHIFIFELKKIVYIWCLI